MLTALKKSLLLTTLKPPGLLHPEGLMSLSSAVPLAVPSLDHSSESPSPSSALKKSWSLKTVGSWKELLLTTAVPLAVPSLAHI